MWGCIVVQETDLQTTTYCYRTDAGRFFAPKVASCSARKSITQRAWFENPEDFEHEERRRVSHEAYMHQATTYYISGFQNSTKSKVWGRRTNEHGQWVERASNHPIPFTDAQISPLHHFPHLSAIPHRLVENVMRF